MALVNALNLLVDGIVVLQNFSSEYIGFFNQNDELKSMQYEPQSFVIALRDFGRLLGRQNTGETPKNWSKVM